MISRHEGLNTECTEDTEDTEEIVSVRQNSEIRET